MASILFALAALINLAPLVGVVSAEQLRSLYGVAVDDPDLLLLLRHRAVLLGAVGGLLGVAAVRPRLRLEAFVVGLLSMSSFAVLAWSIPFESAALQRVLYVDYVGIVALLVGGALHFTRENRAQ